MTPWNRFCFVVFVFFFLFLTPFTAEELKRRDKMASVWKEDTRALEKERERERISARDLHFLRVDFFTHTHTRARLELVYWFPNPSFGLKWCVILLKNSLDTCVFFCFFWGGEDFCKWTQPEVHHGLFALGVLMLAHTLTLTHLLLLIDLEPHPED